MFLFLCLVALGVPAKADHCGPAATVPAMMLDKYQEVLALQLVAQDGSLIEVYLALPVTPGAAATWTIVQTTKGVTCALANGPDWLIPDEHPKEGPET